jgi:hypothetical protein
VREVERWRFVSGTVCEYQSFRRHRSAPAQLVKRLERGEPCQAGHVAAEPPALGEVERPERSQPCQRGQVAAELTAKGEVKRLERGYFGGLLGAEGQVDGASPALAGRTGQTSCKDSQSGIATISKPVHSILKWEERNQQMV